MRLDISKRKVIIIILIQIKYEQFQDKDTQKEFDFVELIEQVENC